VAEDRAALLEIMKSLGFPIRRHKTLAAWIAQRLGRLKSNGLVTHRSPMSTLLELEMLRLAVEGKAAGCRTLGKLTDLADGGESARLEELLSRAGRQADVLEQAGSATKGRDGTWAWSGGALWYPQPCPRRRRKR
jgi:hypothetical protein